MKLIKFEDDKKEAREAMIQKIKSSKGALLICDNEVLSYQSFNLSDVKIIAACELVKQVICKEFEA